MASGWLAVQPAGGQLGAVRPSLLHTRHGSASAVTASPAHARASAAAVSHQCAVRRQRLQGLALRWQRLCQRLVLECPTVSSPVRRSSPPPGLIKAGDNRCDAEGGCPNPNACRPTRTRRQLPGAVAASPTQWQGARLGRSASCGPPNASVGENGRSSRRPPRYMWKPRWERHVNECASKPGERIHETVPNPF